MLEIQQLDFTCKGCGGYVEVKDSKKHHLLCPARSRTTAYCGYCGDPIISFIFMPDVQQQPKILMLGNIMTCGKCYYKAINLLIANNAGKLV